jgi:hypothetical protein
MIDTNTNDDAADTHRFRRFDIPIDPDATSIYDLRAAPPPRYVGRSWIRRRRIHDTQQEIDGLRDAIASGWDVGPELAYQERRLATLMAAG